MNTEEKIKQAAKEVFMTKGYEGCSSREIAKAAGMNVALVNYYFRSKGQLFQLVFETAMEDFVTTMVHVFGQEKSLREKISILIEKEYELLHQHPELPIFIINEINRDFSCVDKSSRLMEKIAATGIFLECQKAQDAGEMRKMDMINITLLIMSNCDFPFMGKNLFMGLHGISSEQMNTHLHRHKEIVKDMLINYLFPSK